MRYIVLKDICLELWFEREHGPCIIPAGTILETSNDTIWVITKDNKRQESISTTSVIDSYLLNGKIEGLKD
jgi:hypothetical protein